MQQPTDIFDKHLPSYRHTYTERDVILYALGLGVRDFPFVYESHATFRPLSTFCIVCAHPVVYSVIPLLAQYIPGLQASNALHGEQYLELMAPLPVAGTLITRVELVDVLDKGGRAVVVLRTTTKDDATGRDVAINEFTSFMLGTHPFPSATNPAAAPRAAAAVARNDPPSRAPDAVVPVATSIDQAALYRLSGDYNPLHIDPEMAQLVGFERPILHGLCSLGIAVRAVVRRYGGDDPDAVRSVKARFSKHVFPGETLRVAMWVVGPDTVVFQARVEEREGAVALSAAAVVLRPGVLAAAAGGGEPVVSRL